MRSMLLVMGALAVAAAAAASRRDPPTPGERLTVVAAPPASRAVPKAPASRAAVVRATPPARIMAARGTWWRPLVSDTWQWQLTGRINTSYAAAVYDVDLFDAPDAVLARLRRQGRRIVCYVSAGSSENWRPDFDQFRPEDMGRPLDGWPGERWLDIRSANVRRIMAARLDLAAERGCDGVEPDNVDGYSNRNGLGLSADDQLDYNRFLAAEAHARGLAVGLKNDLGQVAALADVFDFAVNEQCHQYRECDRLRPFTRGGKPVWNAEYARRFRDDAGARDALCAGARMDGLRTLVLPVKLDGSYRYSCD